MDRLTDIQTKINFSSDSFQKYFKNTAWLFGEKVVRIVLGAVVIISITNYLGAEQFGLYSYAISFAGIFAVVAGLGLEPILARELVKEPHNAEKLLGTAFVLKIFGAVISLLLITVAAIAASHDPFTNLLIFIIAASPLFQAVNVIEFFFQSKVLSKYTAVVQFISFTLTSIIKLLLIVLHASLLSLVIVTTLEFVFQAVGYVVVFQLYGQRVSQWKVKWGTALSMLKDSWPLILSGLVISVYMKIDQVMIKQMLGDSQVGYYASAVRLCEAWYFFPTMITASVFPAIIHAKNISEKLYMNRMQKLYDLLGGVAVVIAVIVTIFSRYIIGLLYTPEFASAASVLTIYIWAGVATFLGVASSQYLIAENYTRMSFYRTFIGMVINVLLNFILIPRYGINGAAVATLISYSAATFSVIFSTQTRRQFYMMVQSIVFLNIIRRVFKRGTFV